MKKKIFVLGLYLMFFTNGFAFAQRQLDEAEILQILHTLTDQPQTTWIESGTITAKHEEYKAPKTTDLQEISEQIKQERLAYKNNPNKAELTDRLRQMKYNTIPFNVRYKNSNEYTMNSNVIVRYDGERFYWDIDVQSRTDSMKPLAGNFMAEQFNLKWNAKRAFAWDGQKYTMYFQSGGNAIVTEAPEDIPVVVNGPLTAGVVPWGYGIYQYDNLSSAELSAIEIDSDGQKEINLTLNYPDSMEMVFTLDPAKGYAVMSYTMTGPGNSMTVKSYDDYELVSGKWIPNTIVIERYDKSVVPPRLLGYDIWDFTSISSVTPQPESFDVQYETDALIEYYSSHTDKPLTYCHSEPAAPANAIDTESLLYEKLAIASSSGDQPQNCATVAMKYVASQLGKVIDDQELAQLVSAPDKSTSLYDLHQFAQGAGLYCRAIKTDLQTLKSLGNVQVILHLPATKHYVVLGNIDGKYVRLIDLDKNRFFYRVELDAFELQWPDGTALIVADDPAEFAELPGTFTEIDDARLRSITGADDCTFGCYACTELLQEYDVFYCSVPIFYECGGTYRIYEERWGPKFAEAGYERGTAMLSYVKSPCVNDPFDPFVCIITGNWTSYYMRACG